jgi:pimeloyl-ACP methyl ester carboxylesterase
MEEPLAVSTPDGRTLTVREVGDPAGVPLIVHHGTPGSSLPYAPFAEAAEKEGIRMIGYDRPGYGASTRLPRRNAADCAADVAAICDALGIDRFVTWGTSGGGPHALSTATLLPDRCAAAATLASIRPSDAGDLDFRENRIVSCRTDTARGSPSTFRASKRISPKTTVI